MFYEEALPILLADTWFRIDCERDESLVKYFPEGLLGIRKLRLLVGSLSDPQIPPFSKLREVEIEQFYFEVGNLREKDASTSRKLTTVIKSTGILRSVQNAFAGLECHPTFKIEVRITWDQFERAPGVDRRAPMTWENGDWLTMNRDIVRPSRLPLSTRFITDQWLNRDFNCQARSTISSRFFGIVGSGMVTHTAVDTEALARSSQ